MFYKNKNLLIVVFIFKFINSAVSTYDASLEAYRTSARALNASITDLNLLKQSANVSSALRDLATLQNLKQNLEKLGITQESLNQQILLLKKPDTLPTKSFVLSTEFAKDLAKSLPKELQNYNWGKTNLFTDLPNFITNLVITEEPDSFHSNTLSKDIIEKAFSLTGMLLEPIKSARIRKEVNNLLKQKFKKLQDYQEVNAKFQQQKALDSKLFDGFGGTFKELEAYQEKLQAFKEEFDKAISETQKFKNAVQAEYDGLVSESTGNRTIDTKILKEIKSRFKDILKVSGITDPELQKALNKFLQENRDGTPQLFYESLKQNSFLRNPDAKNRVTSIKDYFTNFIIAKNHLDKATQALNFLKKDQETFLKNIKDSELISKYQVEEAAKKVKAQKSYDKKVLEAAAKAAADAKILADQVALEKAKALAAAEAAAENKVAALEKAKTEASEEAKKAAADSNEANQKEAAERLAQANQEHQEAQARLEAQAKEHQEAQARLEALQRLEDEAK